MLATSITLGLGYLGYEVINYINYIKTVNYSNNKKKDTIENTTEKSTWIYNYLLNLEKEELRNWIIKNIRTNITIENISRIRVLKCLSFNIYFETYKNLNDSNKLALDQILVKIEKILEHTFTIEPDNFEYYKFGHNKIITTYKPLIFYSALHLIKKYTYNCLTSFGFKKYETKDSKIVYFYYKNGTNRETTIFIHGLGFGTTPYLNFILDLAKDVDLIIPILPNISNMEFSSIFDEITDEKLFPSYNMLKNDFRELLLEHNITTANLIGHSFGTIIMAIILQDKDIRKIISNKIFIDPVCFIDECYKIFRYIDNPDHRDSIINKVFNTIVYDDIYVRYATQRFLNGPNYWIFDYQLLDKTIVILSYKDRIVPSVKIYERLSSEHIPCIIIEDAEHGDIFTAPFYCCQSLIIDFNRNGFNKN